MRFTSDEVASRIGAVSIGDPISFDGASIDSRTLAPGELFVPVVAERDGHDFVPAARAAGAACYLCAESHRDRIARWGGSALVVDDTEAALVALGHLARSRIADRVIGITGSVGKTTVKTLTAAAVGATRPEVVASPGSFNNELGVPLTLLSAPDGAPAAVIEMGARGVGHIAALCDIARPTVGVVIAVGRAHLETFGSLDGVARAKGELIEAIPVDGTAVLNADDARCAAMRSRASAPVVTYGVAASAADVRAELIELDELMRPTFTVRSPWGSVRVTLALSGHYQISNALAAFTAAAAAEADADVDVHAIGLGLATAAPPTGRMVVHRSARGSLVIDDSYNANPTSMTAALRSLAGLGSGRRVAVLGEMAELGRTATADHAEIAELAAELGVEVIAVDTADYGLEPISVSDAVARTAALGPTDVILVKGSRVAALERVVDGLTR